MYFYLLLIKVSLQEIIDDCAIYKQGLVLSMYYHTECTYCMEYEKVLKILANESEMKYMLKIQKVNCGVCDCGPSSIKGFPTTILRNNGTEIGRTVAMMDLKKLKSFILKKSGKENAGYKLTNEEDSTSSKEELHAKTIKIVPGSSDNIYPIRYDQDMKPICVPICVSRTCN